MHVSPCAGARVCPCEGCGGVSGLCVGMYRCDCVCKCACMAACLRGVQGCPCAHPASSGGSSEPRLCPPAPAMPDLPETLPGVTPQGPDLHRGWQWGQDPQGLQVQEAPVSRSSPSSLSLPATAMLPALREGHNPASPGDPQQCQTPTGLSCAPQGCGAAGAVPTRGQGAVARQPPHRSLPHRPDAGQRREEIQALSAGWLQPLPRPRPLARNFLVWPSQQCYSGLCLFHWAGGGTGH